MEGRIKPELLGTYSGRFAQAVVDSFFASKERITGKEILSLTPVQQINVFIIRELMIQWEAESAKLRSPWFDYQAKEVREALIQFRIALSNHISVDQKDFIPLLEKAVFDTLRLALTPYDYFADLLVTDQDRMIHLPALRMHVRHMRINRKPMETMLEEIDRNGISKMTGKEAFALLDRVLEESDFTPIDPEEIISAMSEVLPLAARSTHPKPASGEKTNIPDAVVKNDSAPSARKPQVIQTNLYEELESDSRPTLADDFRKRKIDKLREHLTINQKFMFTKMLFNGDFELFDQAIERIDRMDHIGQAERFLQQEYSDWNRDSEEYQEFRLLLERRFMSR